MCSTQMIVKVGIPYTSVDCILRYISFCVTYYDMYANPTEAMQRARLTSVADLVRMHCTPLALSDNGHAL